MKYSKLLLLGCLVVFSYLVFFEIFVNTDISFAQSGSVQVIGSTSTAPVDPENPEEIVDPGEGPSTKGALRFDFVSTLDFGRAEITKGNRVYQALAQQFLGDVGPRGSYIQVTDQRAVSTGWSVQVRQNTQFRNSLPEADKQELLGAVLSLNNAWANSSGNSDVPTVTRDTIELNAIGTTYELVNASSGQGRGVWTIAFGASQTNTNQQDITLTPVLDKDGRAVVNGTTRKQLYRNSAVTLSIPTETKIYPTSYETELTWILGDLP